MAAYQKIDRKSFTAGDIVSAVIAGELTRSENESHSHAVHVDPGTLQAVFSHPEVGQEISVPPRPEQKKDDGGSTQRQEVVDKLNELLELQNAANRQRENIAMLLKWNAGLAVLLLIAVSITVVTLFARK